jgi:ubiquitin-protein ligase
MSATRRLPRELARISDLSNVGIYYKQNPQDLERGLALIIGPADSIYANSLLFFKFEFPSDYPFVPPKVEFLTNDGDTRFHPNLYVDGKVCLSILGTYSGPSWQSTMSLSMILLSLKALLDNNPLRHEPGYENIPLTHNYALHYKEYVHHQIIKYTVNELHENKILHNFESDIKDILPELKLSLKKQIQEKIAINPVDFYPYIPYGMAGKTNWNSLFSILENGSQ